MPNGVPFFFRGPTASRFYFISGDHWVVRSDSDTIAALRKKQYSRWQLALSYLLIPGIIASAGIVLYVVTANQEALWAFLAAAFAAGLPMLYLNRTELAHLDRTPLNTFVLRSDGSLEIQGRTYEINSIADLTFEYRFYLSTGGQGDAGFSELDVVLTGGPTERRIKLLSQTGNWALKHTLKLKQLTGIQVERTTIAR